MAAFVKDAPCAGVAVRCHAYPDRLRSLPNGAEILQDQRHPADQDGPPLVRLATLGMVPTRTLSEDRLRSGRLSAGPTALVWLAKVSRTWSGRVAFNSARRCNRRRSRPARYLRVFGERDSHDRETDSYRVPSTLDIAPRVWLPASARERLRGCPRGDPPSDWVVMGWKGSVRHATVQASQWISRQVQAFRRSRARRSISRRYA